MGLKLLNVLLKARHLSSTPQQQLTSSSYLWCRRRPCNKLTIFNWPDVVPMSHSAPLITSSRPV
eukprot:3723836-Prymnesium_polylepis.1